MTKEQIQAELSAIVELCSRGKGSDRLARAHSLVDRLHELDEKAKRFEQERIQRERLMRLQGCELRQAYHYAAAMPFSGLEKSQPAGDR